MTRLMIARHGNTFAPGEAPRRIGRSTDLPLVEKGYEQARRLGNYLTAHTLVPDRVYCSTLQRTIRTAETAIDAMALDQVPETRGIFDEIDYGPDENMPEEQVRERIGEETLRMWEDKNIPPPGWQADAERIIQNWRNFAEEMLSGYSGQSILVVTSGGIARFAPYITGDFENFRASYTPKLAPGALGLIGHDGVAWQVENWNIRP